MKGTCPCFNEEVQIPDSDDKGAASLMLHCLLSLDFFVLWGSDW